ncbi:hypothetical protein [Kutzneria sp. 744]|uniref:hypothetical protein n=1 Tax=Kutzneria sp. (strain 744) TaxID=345341 RepID=UPI0003EECAF2|nr:hypothetical protein [Kutzneria sp. 744]EWM19263.1 hypothetical protein KUTG_09567 [Kutzneria sp. 744]
MTMTNVVPRGDTVLRFCTSPTSPLMPAAISGASATAPPTCTWNTPDSPAHVLRGVGAVLHHLRIALAAAGWGALIGRGTVPSDPTHIASVRAVRQQPTTEQVAMAAAISVRSSEDADYSEAAVPWTVLNRLAAQARAEGAQLDVVLDHGTRLRMLRRSRSLQNAGVVVVIGVREGEEIAAGAALSAVLLMGTVWGLLGCQLPVRPVVARQVVGPDLVPQVVLRLGYPRT